MKNALESIGSREDHREERIRELEDRNLEIILIEEKRELRANEMKKKLKLYLSIKKSNIKVMGIQKEKRRELVDRFNQDETSVFCISLKAGGTGLNLTAVDIVIHFDPWWNLAVQNQATDRAHRIGQENRVTVYRLVTKGTIEENIIRLQQRKKDLAETLLAGEGIGSGSFTKEELKEIIVCFS